MDDNTHKPEKPSLADNGKPGKPPAIQDLQRPMKPARLAQVEAGLQAYHETAAELDHLKATIDQQRLDLQARDLEIKSLHERQDQMMDAHTSAIGAMESRLHTAEANRDLAVSEAVALKTILASMKRIFDLAKLDGQT